MSETLNVIDHITNAPRLELRVSSQTCLPIFRHCPTTYRIYQMSARLLQASRTLHTPLPPRIHTNRRDTNDLQFPKSSQSSAIERTSTPM